MLAATTAKPAVLCRAFKIIEWILFRALVAVEGYSTYITVFYLLVGIILATLLLTVWVTVAIKGSDSVSPWLGR
jgi:hypothetical protein